MKLLYSLGSVILFLSACVNNSREIILKNVPRERIVYETSKLHGDFINISKQVPGGFYRYNIQIAKDGRVLNVLKYDEKYLNNTSSAEALRNQELLVTDTMQKNNPTFFGNDINGYYTDTGVIKNVVQIPSPKFMVSKITDDEIKIFNMLDSLTKHGNIKYATFDLAKVLGWFKYEF